MESLPINRKRSSPAPQNSWQRPNKDHRRSQTQLGPQSGNTSDDQYAVKKEQGSFAKKQTRLNQLQEAEQMREWVSKEDEFVLTQAKKKARIRVRDGRAKLIDWLAVTLDVLEPSSDELEDDGTECEIDVVDPAALLEGLGRPQLEDLLRDIESYLILEKSGKGRKYWAVRHVLICFLDLEIDILAVFENPMSGPKPQIYSCWTIRSSSQCCLYRR